MNKNSLPLKNKNVKRKKNQILLTYHDKEVGKPIRYTYINADGEEKEFTDKSYNIIKKSSTQYIASKNKVIKIPITYFETVPNTEYQKPYFTYRNNKYTGKVEFDESTNSYIGTIYKYEDVTEEVELIKE